MDLAGPLFCSRNSRRFVTLFLPREADPGQVLLYRKYTLKRVLVKGGASNDDKTVPAPEVQEKDDLENNDVKEAEDGGDDNLPSAKENRKDLLTTVTGRARYDS